MRGTPWTSRFLAGAIVVACFAVGTGQAQQPQNPASSTPPANPEQLLQQNPNAGAALSDAVQALAVADPSQFNVLLGLMAKATDQQKSAIATGLADATKLEAQTNQTLATDWVQTLALADPSSFAELLGLAANATDQQKSAIAAGLAEATKVEVLTNQALAADWQTQIAAITDPTFKTAATNAFGDVQLGSVGGGAVGAAGSGLGGSGSGSGTSGGTPEDIRSNPFNTSSFTFNSSTTSGTSGSVSP
jgi:hypothetical protein